MNRVSQNKENKNLFWTGGWDSTFQLLRLLLIHWDIVTPYYLIDTSRKSAGTEIRTIKQIQEHLVKEYPYVEKLLQPTKYFPVECISSDLYITKAFESISKEKHLGYPTNKIIL